MGRNERPRKNKGAPACEGSGPFGFTRCGVGDQFLLWWPPPPPELDELEAGAGELEAGAGELETCPPELDPPL